MFTINNVTWDIQYLYPSNSKLKRSDGTCTLGVTDWNDKTIYLSNKLQGALLERVLCHELCHCFVFSYGIEMDIETEEIVADFLSLYGRDVIFELDVILDNLVKYIAN